MIAALGNYLIVDNNGGKDELGAPARRARERDELTSGTMWTMAQLRRPQPPEENTVKELHSKLEAGGQKLHGANGGAVHFEVRSGLWHLQGERPDGRSLEGEVDPSELFAWLAMHGVSYEATVGLFDEYPPGPNGKISTTAM